ncbi:MAG TPA: hypothetical protein VGF92_03355 [Stellaceae bacterium]
MTLLSAAQASSADKPMIADNPDGTFIIQKAPPKPNAEGAKVKTGLAIPPQVVVPIVPTPEKKR